VLFVKDIGSDQWLSVWIAVKFAEDALHIFEDKYSEDKRPFEAIEAAKAWLRNPAAAYAAAYAADAAADADAAAAAYAAAYADAAYAAYAAADAAYAAAYAAYAAAYAAAAADAAAYAAAYAYSNVARKAYIHNILMKDLSFFIKYKLEKNQGFGCLETVFEAASDEDKEKLLFLL
jgi:hypothetical protein